MTRRAAFEVIDIVEIVNSSSASSTPSSPRPAIEALRHRGLGVIAATRDASVDLCTSRTAGSEIDALVRLEFSLPACASQLAAAARQLLL